MKKRTRKELNALLASLPKESCSCGHFDVKAGGYYKTAARGDSVNICVPCYRDRERARQRGYRGGATPTALASAGNRVARDTDPIDDGEVKAALGVLRDHRAQRRQSAQGYVYCIGEKDCWEAVKVGYSVKPEARVAELQTGNPRALVLLASFEGTEADERRLHAKHLHRNILLEWFRPDDALLSEFGLEMPASVTRDASERST